VGSAVHHVLEHFQRPHFSIFLGIGNRPLREYLSKHLLQVLKQKGSHTVDNHDDDCQRSRGGWPFTRPIHDDYHASAFVCPPQPPHAQGTLRVAVQAHGRSGNCNLHARTTPYFGLSEFIFKFFRTCPPLFTLSIFKLEKGVDHGNFACSAVLVLEVNS